MRISGFQPVSLLDYPGVIASIVFTQGCPFRCGYCHNPELIPIQENETSYAIPEETIFAHLQKHKLFIEGICITGGEPTIHPDLPAFIKKLKRFGYLVKLDTNGINPTMVERLIQDHSIDFIAMDLKHTWERYSDVIGINQAKAVDNCRKTFHLIQSSSILHEFRTTVYSGTHTKDDLLTITDQLNDGERYALQEIRYEKTADAHLPKTPPLDLEEIAALIRNRRPSLQVEVRSA